MDARREVEEFIRGAGLHVLEAAGENIFITDVEGRIVFLNSAARETTGYELRDLAGKNIDIFYQDQCLPNRFAQEIKEKGQAKTYEAIIVDRQGRRHIFSIKKAPLVDPRGVLIGFLAVSRDVTRERLHEEELRAIKEFNEAVLNSAMDMITVTDVEGMVMYFNPAAEKITGFAKEEILGKPISMFYRDREFAFNQLAEIGASRKPAEYEAVIVDKTGLEHLFSIRKAPLFDDEGELIGFTATSRDVTELRRQEQEIKRLQDFNEAILNSAHDLIVVTDPDGLITYFNPMAENTLGYGLDELKGKPIGGIYKDPTLSEQKLTYIRSSGRPNSYQAEISSKDGRELTLEVNKAPLFTPQGELFGFASISRDITRRLLAEERVCELENLLSENSPVQVESELIQTRVSDLSLGEAQSCGPDDTVSETALRLIQLDLPGLPVVGAGGEILGLVTLKDLAEKGLFHDADMQAPVRMLMRPNPPTIHPEDFYFDALTAMVKSKAPMLAVAEGGHFRGILTMNDLMRSRGAAIITVLEGIEEQETIAGLAGFRGEVDRILSSLVTEGALASQVTGIITEFNDRITRRVIALSLAALGPPPVNFAWLGLGSEGRKEQTLTTDQDNALVFEDVPPGDEQAPAYFRTLAENIVTGLAACGFKPCRGRIMADNPKWFGGLSQWRDRIQSWVNEPAPRQTRDAMTFLDFRGVFGAMDLVEKLRADANAIFTKSPNFLTPMAEDSLSKAPPLGLFKRFVVEKSGPNKGMINLKVQGTLVLIDCLRLLAVKEGLFETNSLERLAGLKSRGIFSQAAADSIKEAYQTLMGLRLLNNIKSIQESREPSNHINPETLNRWRRQRLRDAFMIAEDLQKKVRKQFWWLK
ncbi:MAG: PAS domain S-box protein [Pseudomonadota bacterium]